MGKITGFLEFERETAGAAAGRGAPASTGASSRASSPRRSCSEQGARCMDCGIPFCHKGCPLGNIIPDWNDLVYRGRWQEAIERLHSTNNFPEFTGRICPAPCEEACVLNINDDPVTIKQIEKQIIDHAFEGGLDRAAAAARSAPARRVAVVGSGPAGLALRAAARARRPSRSTRLRARRPHRRAAALRHPRLQAGEAAHRPPHRADGGRGRRRSAPSVNVGVDVHGRRAAARVRRDRARRRRDQAARPADARAASSTGIHFAMEFLPQQNKVVAGDAVAGPDHWRTGKHVVILGGGDTGSDCLGTSNRQGADVGAPVRAAAAAARRAHATTCRGRTGR